MNPRKTKRRLEFEALESMALLSAVGMPMHAVGHHHHHHAALIHRASTPTGPDVALNLSGTVGGTYRVVGGTAAAFNGKGMISPVGRAHLRGSISMLPGGNGGALTLNFGRRGQIFAVVTGQQSLTTFTYQITGGTKSFAGDTGSGVATVSIASLGAPRGHFSLTLQGTSAT